MYASNKPLKFEIKKKMKSRSERVKCIELHPELPWALVSLYSGNITIYDYSNEVEDHKTVLTKFRMLNFNRAQWRHLKILWHLWEQQSLLSENNGL